MFKTARFKIHNTSRHKTAMLQYALTHYHLTLKRVLETALAMPDLRERISVPDKKGRQRVNRFAIGPVLRTVAPKGWALAPLRDYLIGDATAMLLSHFSKLEKAKHESNPPTMPSLEPLTEEQVTEAYREFATTAEFPLKPQQLEKIEELREVGKTRVAERLSKVYQGWAASRQAGQVLRKVEGSLPRPIEFTHTEFGRGCLLSRRGNDYYVLVRLFAKGHRYWSQKTLDEGFTDWRTRELIEGRKYPGLILPLELGRDYHEGEYLAYGKPQSAKLLIKRRPDGQAEFYAHITFKFSPEAIPTETLMGIDRGAAKIGAATIIDRTGKVVAEKLDLEGAAFSAEMARIRSRIAEAQRRGSRTGRFFRLRGRKSEIVIGEYANRIVSAALRHKSQIVFEKLDEYRIASFLSQSQVRKLHDAIIYKAERVGLPKPVEVPAQYTSRTCAGCGHQSPDSRPKQDVFRCVACGHSANADDNASEVIALRALHQELKGGKFQKFPEFQNWLREVKGRDGLLAKGA